MYEDKLYKNKYEEAGFVVQEVGKYTCLHCRHIFGDLSFYEEHVKKCNPSSVVTIVDIAEKLDKIIAILEKKGVNYV